jgi:hypothetical protein
MFSAPGPVLVSIEGVESSLHLLRWVLFSCVALPDSFSTILMASSPVFIFCAPELILGITEGVRSLIYILRTGTHFRRYRVRRVPFSCFALPDSFLAVPRESGAVFMFCAPGLILGGTDGIGCRFHVLRSRTIFGSNVGVRPNLHVLRTRTRFGWYRVRQVPF